MNSQRAGQGPKVHAERADRVAVPCEAHRSARTPVLPRRLDQGEREQIDNELGHIPRGRPLDRKLNGSPEGLAREKPIAVSRPLTKDIHQYGLLAKKS